MGLDDSQPPKHDQQPEQTDRDTNPHRQGFDRAIRASLISNQEEEPGSQACQDRDENGSDDDFGGHDLIDSFGSVIETKRPDDCPRRLILLYASMMGMFFRSDDRWKRFRSFIEMRGFAGLIPIETDTRQPIVEAMNLMIEIFYIVDKKIYKKECGERDHRSSTSNAQKTKKRFIYPMTRTRIIGLTRSIIIRFYARKTMAITSYFRKEDKGDGKDDKIAYSNR